MTLRPGHGRGAGVPRVEVLPADELPAGVPAPTGSAAPVQAAVARRANGTVADRCAARELGARGGRARAERARALRALEGLGMRSDPAALRPYLADAEAFAAAEVTRLAQTVGGGHCGAAPASMVQSAALQLAASRAAFASGDFDRGSKLANDSRQNLLAAHELCAKEAKALPQESAVARLRRELSEGT